MGKGKKADLPVLNGKKRKISLPWMVGSFYSSVFTSLRDIDKADYQLSSGYDCLTRLVQNVKNVFLLPGL